MEKITQILLTEWKGREGDIMQDVVGLGEDSKLYKWNKSTGCWVAWVINR